MSRLPADAKPKGSHDEPSEQSSSTTSRMESMFELDVVKPMQDFQDPSQEWRRLFSELSGRSSSYWWPPAAG